MKPSVPEKPPYNRAALDLVHRLEDLASDLEDEGKETEADKLRLQAHDLRLKYKLIEQGPSLNEVMDV